MRQIAPNSAATGLRTVDETLAAKNAQGKAEVGTAKPVYFRAGSFREYKRSSRVRLLLKDAPKQAESGRPIMDVILGEQIARQEVSLNWKAVNMFVSTRWTPRNIVCNKAAIGLTKSVTIVEGNAQNRAAYGTVALANSAIGVRVTVILTKIHAKAKAATGLIQNVILEEENVKTKGVLGMAVNVIFIIPANPNL